MPEMTPLGNQIVPPDPMKGINTFSGILGLQQQRQALETGRYTQESAQAKATVDRQTAKENQSLAQLLSDPVGNGIVDSDGNPTKDAQSIIMRTAPTTGSDSYDKVVKAAKSKIEFNGAVNNLKGQERQEFGSTVAGAAAGAQSPDEVKSAISQLLETKKGTPVYDDYQTLANTTNTILDHVTQKQKETGQIIPIGQEGWRQAALGIGRSVLPAQNVVGAGGIGNPAQATNAAGQNQLVDQVTGARSMPALSGGATNPSTPMVASATTRATGTAGGDVGRMNEVSDLQQQSAAAIPLTERIDQLSHEINSGNLAKHISEGVKWLGFSSVNEARAQLLKDLGQVKGLAIQRAGSDSRAGTILEGYPTDTTPENTVHAAMDYIRGTAKQNLARGKLLTQYQKTDPDGVRGFQAADNVLTRSTDPLMHEYLSLKPEQQAGFYRRNFSTPEQAQEFKDHVNALKKHTRVLDSE